MKILLVHNNYQHRGGTDDYVDALKKLLRKKGHKVLLYKEQSSSINNFKEKIKVSLDMILLKNKNISRIIKKFKPDICHLNNLFPKINFSVVKLCIEKKIPIIQTFHDFRYISLDGIYREKKDHSLLKNYFIDSINKRYHDSYLASIILAISLIKSKKYIEEIDRYIFPNIFSKNVINSFFNLKNKSYILPHFVSFYRVKQARRRNQFVYIGRISKEKGTDELVRVFRTLPKLKLLIVGEGPLRSRLEHLRIPNIKFLGYVSTKEKYRLLGRASFCIIPSKIEELGPLVLIESFMCGTPVIVPDLFSFKEKVKENKTGFYYMHDNVEDLKKAIIRASHQKINIYKQMSKLVKKEYVKYNKESIYYKGLMNIYEQII